MDFIIDSHNISLVELHFDVNDPEEDEETYLDFEEGESPFDFDFEVEIVEEEEGLSVVQWSFYFRIITVFTIQAEYLTYVESEGEGAFDLDEMIEQTYVPVFSELSLLISTLSKALGHFPLIVDPVELITSANFEFK